MAVTVIIPVLVITVAYFAIWISTNRNRLSTKTSRSMEQNKKLAITTLSIITCLPSGISLVFIRHLFHAYSTPMQLFWVAQYANSFLNPVVYSFRMPEFKVFRYSFFGTIPNFLNRLLESLFLVRST